MIDTQLFCKALKFAAHAAAKRDIRYYLLGVRIEWVNDVMDFVGTDGSRLAKVTLCTKVPSAVPIAATIGNDDVKRILSTIGKDKGEVRITIEVFADPAKRPDIRVEAGGVTLNMLGVEGVYPQWRRVIPPAGRESGHMPRLDATLVSDACAAVQPFSVRYKKMSPVWIQPGPVVSDGVLIEPAEIQDPRVLSCQVVVMPMMK